MKNFTFSTILLFLFSVQIFAQQTSLRINAGGTEAAYNGNVFIADSYFDVGSTLVRPQTGLPEPFRSFRFGPSQEMAYDIPVPDGEYTVNLYFAELWFGATGGGAGGAGKRVFDVTIEGQLAEDDLDIFAEVGAEVMLVRTHTVTVTGGILDIDLSSLDAVGGERHPVINAIEVLGPPQRPMILTWQTDATSDMGVLEGREINIGAVSDTGNYTVDWGDGNTTAGAPSHVYDSDGTYTVSISGDVHGVRFGTRGTIRNGTEPKLISIEQWGDIEWTTARYAFTWCENLDVNATDVPDLSGVTDMTGMFEECHTLVGNASFNDWDVGNVTGMASTFRAAASFNAPIGDWDVSMVRNMEQTFLDAGSFDQDISGWDVGNVGEMIYPTLAITNLSTENYDRLLEAWGGLPLQNGVRLDMGTSRYCEGEAARQGIIDDFAWTITDGGKSADCPDNLARTNKGNDNSLSIYPNQATTFVTASFEEPIHVQQILVFDMIGRLMKSYNPIEIGNDGKYTIDVNSYRQGAYIIKMVDNNGVSFQKLMVVE